MLASTSLSHRATVGERSRTLRLRERATVGERSRTTLRSANVSFEFAQPPLASTNYEEA